MDLYKCTRKIENGTLNGVKFHNPVKYIRKAGKFIMTYQNPMVIKQHRIVEILPSSWGKDSYEAKVGKK